MSNKTLIAASAVGLLIILGVGGFFAYNKFIKPQASVESKTEIASTEAPSPTASPSTMQGTLKGLLSQNNVTCKTTFPDNQGQGEVFVANSKMRADVTNTVDNKQMVTHLILFGGDFYMWQDGETTGTKMKFDINKQATSSAETAKKDDASANLDKKVDFQCAPWSADQSKFIPPSDIKFQDLSSLTAPKTSGTPAIDKSICDQIADPASKEACLNAL